jgi:hypothetical protein
MSEQNNQLNSISLDVFKQMNGIDRIKVMKGEGRMFADTVVGRLYFGKEVDLKKPLYVAKGHLDAFWVFNSKAVEVGEL